MTEISKVIKQKELIFHRPRRESIEWLGLLLLIFSQTMWFSSDLRAAQAPQALLGKSISVSWQEEREQRALSQGDWQAVQIQHRSDIYISTAGRIFRRETGMNYRRRKGAYMTGSDDKEISTGNVTFQNTDLVITATAQRGAAVRRVTVQFDPGFGSCQATVINGMTAGETSYVRRALTNGREMEIRSVKTSLVSCKIIDANILQ